MMSPPTPGGGKDHSGHTLVVLTNGILCRTCDEYTSRTFP